MELDMNIILEMQDVLERKIKEINFIKITLQQQIKNQKINSCQHPSEKFLKQKIVKVMNNIKLFFKDFRELSQATQKYKFEVEQIMITVGNAYQKKIRELEEEKKNLIKQNKMQLEINHTMKNQVLELREMINQHLKQNKLTQKLDRKDIETDSNAQSSSSLLKNVDYKPQLDDISSRAPAIQYPPIKLNLEIINQQEELNSNPKEQNYENSTQVKKIQNESLIMKTQVTQQYSDLSSGYIQSERRQSLRKSQSKTKTRFYIDDFRKSMQLQETESEKVSKDVSLQNSQVTHKSICKFNISDIIPIKRQSKIKVSKSIEKKEKKENQIPKIQFSKPLIIELGGGRKSSEVTSVQKKRSTSKEKLKVTQKQNYKILSQQSEVLKSKELNCIVPCRSISKQKLNITIKDNDIKNKPVSKIINQKNVVRTHNNRYLIEELEKIDIYLGDKKTEQRYEGTKKDSIRWGKGKLFYVNGFIYEGDFKDNVRHGHGTLFLNGKQIYRGVWQKDKLSGEGTLRNLQLINKKKLSQNSILRNIFYTGEFCDNRFHGEGTIFIGNNEKLISKFQNGLPIGEYTFINHTGESEYGLTEVKKVLNN